MAKIISILNQKGGSGKTTTCVNLGACLADKGKKVLVVDVDPQSHTTIHLGFKPHEVRSSIYMAMVGRVPAKDIIVRTEVNYLDLFPADISLAGLDHKVARLKDKENILKTILEPLRRKYDYILIDCPPSLGILTVNALVSSQEVLITVQPEFFALEGVSQLLKTIKTIKERLNKNLKINGFLITLYHSRRLLSKDVEGILKKHFKDLVFKTKIRVNVKLAEAPSHGKPIILYAPRSHGAEDYSAFTKEILRRG